MIGSEARGAWKELERQLRPYLARRVASAGDVDDALQEVFVKLHEGLPGLQDTERFGAWVYRIANSVVVDRARARARDPVMPIGDHAEQPSEPEEAADDLQGDLTQCVALFVSRLETPYREAIVLTELQSLSQKEAAQLVGISLSGMKSRVQRGRQKVRHMFDECCRISVDCRGRVVDCEARDLQHVPVDCRDAASQWSRRHG